ncbi:heparanase-like [Centruroides vittatus]|uniref:heparanase-like n=1 Tax=Centruroides vittatus TaxID=120091 RepID=UPI00350FE23E
MVSLILFACILFVCPNGLYCLEFRNDTFYFKMDLNKPIRKVSKEFLSVALDTSILTREKMWERFNTSSPYLLSMAEALSPAFFRFGGNYADYLIFEKPSNTCTHSKNVNKTARNEIIMTGEEWLKLNKFATQVKWQLLFDLNALLRKDGAWNPDNAEILMKFNNKFGFFVDWELGNELNSHHQLKGEQLGKDFLKLRRILNYFNTTKFSLIVGPDITSHKFQNFLKGFLQEARTVLNAVTFHHYYVNGRTAVMEDFLNVDILDSLIILIKKIHKIVTVEAPKLSIWLGETSSAYGGGAPHLSNSYIAGFMWLDKLGISAVHGIDVVIRQSLMQGNYALLTKNLKPQPDYWLSVLYKWLVGDKVIKIHTSPSDRKLRIYAHCTQTERLYNISDSVTVFIINLHNSTVKVYPTELNTSPIHQYLLTPNAMNLLSRNVKLNGQELKLNGTNLPKFIPKVIFPPIVIPSYSFGFYVFPKISAPACVNKSRI